ncbi:hypothetical protein [Streptococcus agalactiae]|uniref:hypothetical protein n=1 Tax=Streptococcus agalactiae TaxID=1311 RepID=UPI000F5E1CFA|nr:hypothetical protein [Streptococcus agalactiae]RRA88169.1 hypothetical protein D5F88_01235 [Streptococcus agalactiae]
MLDQVDQPQPEVPQFVADWYEKQIKVTRKRLRACNGSVGLRAGILVKLTLEAFCKYSASRFGIISLLVIERNF